MHELDNCHSVYGIYFVRRIFVVYMYCKVCVYVGGYACLSLCMYLVSKYTLLYVRDRTVFLVLNLPTYACTHPCVYVLMHPCVYITYIHGWFQVKRDVSMDGWVHTY